MKKLIKNYVAKLQENEKKGFSLVELIIVMAIMAILVGVVASQVLPYMEKSRMSKDQQQLSSLATDIVSAISQSESSVSSFGPVQLNACKDNDATYGGGTWVKELGLLRSSDGVTVTSVTDIEKTIVGKFKSKSATKDANAKKVMVQYSNTTGIVTVYCAGGTVDKLKVETE